MREEASPKRGAAEWQWLFKTPYPEPFCARFGRFGFYTYLNLFEPFILPLTHAFGRSSFRYFPVHIYYEFSSA